MSAKNDFVRKLDKEIIQGLKNQRPLFERLLNDTKSKKKAVFPAIRNNRIDFYFSGGKLFSYEKGEFSTHYKYASVLVPTSEDPYVKETQLNNLKKIETYLEGYDRIKENCSLYAGVEAIGVSELYGKYSYLSNGNKVVVLDIEVAFQAEDEADDRRMNRVDILLFDTKTATLRFYEAKHYTNKEIWREQGTIPPVVEQVKRYENQIKDNKVRILDTYKAYVEILNNLFDINLPTPKVLDNNVGLLIFGFDQNQLDGRFEKLLLGDNSLKGINLYKVGDISKVEIDNLWKGTKLQ